MFLFMWFIRKWLQEKNNERGRTERLRLESSFSLIPKKPWSINYIEFVPSWSSAVARWFLSPFHYMGFPGGSEGKASACNAGDLGSIPGSGRSPEERKWQPIPVLLPGNSHGQRSLLDKSMGSQRVGHDWATSPFTREWLRRKNCLKQPPQNLFQCVETVYRIRKGCAMV